MEERGSERTPSSVSRVDKQAEDANSKLLVYEVGRIVSTWNIGSIRKGRVRGVARIG